MDIRAAADAAARKHGLPVNVFRTLIGWESGWHPQIVSKAGAVGLGQLMPGTAKGLGVDPFDPIANLDGAARYLKRQLDHFGQIDLALAAYNAGPGAVEQYGGIPPYAETQRYVHGILSAAGDQHVGPAPQAAATRAPLPSSPSSPEARFVEVPGFTQSGAAIEGAIMRNLSMISSQGGYASPEAQLGELTSSLAMQPPTQAGTFAAPPEPHSGSPAAPGPLEPGLPALKVTGASLDSAAPSFRRMLLEAARAAGATELVLTSSTRSLAHNAAVGGVTHSNHLPDASGHSHAVDGYALIKGKRVALGDLTTLSKFGLRSGDQPGFYRGARDPVHVDDAHNQRV